MRHNWAAMAQKFIILCHKTAKGVCVLQAIGQGVKRYETGGMVTMTLSIHGGRLQLSMLGSIFGSTATRGGPYLGNNGSCYRLLGVIKDASFVRVYQDIP